MLTGSKQAGGLANGFGPGIPRKTFEGAIHPDQGAIQLADYDWIGRSFQRSRLQGEEILKLSGLAALSSFWSFSFHAKLANFLGVGTGANAQNQRGE